MRKIAMVFLLPIQAARKFFVFCGAAHNGFTSISGLNIECITYLTNGAARGHAGAGVIVFTDAGIQGGGLFARCFGDDVNDTGERIGTVNRRLCAANNFNAFDGFDINAFQIKGTAT